MTEVSSRDNTDSQSFSSLAALTAHHLKKSNPTNDKELREKRQSPSLQFVIPKLSINSNSEATENKLPLKFSNDESSEKQLVANSSSNRYPMDLLQNDFSNMSILSRGNILMDVKLEKQFQSPMAVVNDIRSPSPDGCVIDLTMALKEAQLLADGSFSNSTASGKFYRDAPNLEIYMRNAADFMPNMLPVTLNLCALRHVRLRYTKTQVSMFGKTLCRKWKTKKPILKVLVQHRGAVKPFDFSVPYRNASRSQ